MHLEWYITLHCFFHSKSTWERNIAGTSSIRRCGYMSLTLHMNQLTTELLLIKGTEIFLNWSSLQIPEPFNDAGAGCGLFKHFCQATISPALCCSFTFWEKKKKKQLGASFHSLNFKPVCANAAAERSSLSIFPRLSLLTPMLSFLLAQMFSQSSTESAQGIDLSYN